MERPISSSALVQVQAAVFRGEKIVAIKTYREDTGASLKDAKNAVDRLEAELRTASPQKFSAPPRKKMGCGVCLAIVVSAGLLIALTLLGILR